MPDCLNDLHAGWNRQLQEMADKGSGCTRDQRTGAALALLWIEPQLAALHEQLAAVQRERDEAKESARFWRSKDVDGCWRWQGDGEDHPESLVCSVLMTAVQLREILSDRDRSKMALVKLWKHTPKIDDGKRCAGASLCLVCRRGYREWAQVPRLVPGPCSDADCLSHVVEAALAAPPEPIPMILHCPKCGLQHVDEPEPDICECGHPRRTHVDGRCEGTYRGSNDRGLCECKAFNVAWDNPPHKSHLCHGCGTIWRPANVPTNGVKSIATRGEKDTWDGSSRRASSMCDAADEDD